MSDPVTMAAVAATSTYLARLAPIWKRLPLWAKLFILAIPAILLILLGILFIGLLFGIIWIVYAFISSGIWKSIPAEVGAAIIAGLFAVLTLIVGSYLTTKNQIETTLKIKEIEARESEKARKQEARTAESAREENEKLRKAEFYSEIINKLTSLLLSNSKTGEILNEFYGKLRTQASSDIVINFMEIVQSLEVCNGSRTELSSIYHKANTLIVRLRTDLGWKDDTELQLYNSAIPKDLNKIS